MVVFSLADMAPGPGPITLVAFFLCFFLAAFLYLRFSRKFGKNSKSKASALFFAIVISIFVFLIISQIDLELGRRAKADLFHQRHMASECKARASDCNFFLATHSKSSKCPEKICGVCYHVDPRFVSVTSNYSSVGEACEKGDAMAIYENDSYY